MSFSMSFNYEHRSSFHGFHKYLRKPITGGKPKQFFSQSGFMLGA